MSTPTTLVEGLTTQQALTQRQKVGPNAIYQSKPIRVWDIVREEISEPMMIMLIVTGVLYSLLGEARDAVTIFVIIALLIASEVYTEYRAKTAIAALTKIASLKTRVRRDHQIVEIDSLDIVPRDVLILTPGTKIAADARVQESIGLQVDESALTGESFPVEKAAGDDGTSALYAGTFVKTGEGQAVVITTGARTRLGQIAAQTETIAPPRTALQTAMKSLAGKLVYVAVFFAIAIPVLGVLRGQDWKLMFLTGLALAFAVIPEELPIVITMVLGLGSYRLSKRNFLIKQLRTAESLGNVTTIVTDKTGTITENHLKIAATYPERNAVLRAARLSISEYATTPIDTVIQEQVDALDQVGTLVRERDLLTRKTRAVIRKDGQSFTLYVSGAPEAVFAACATVPEGAHAVLHTQTMDGRRVIAVATRSLAPAEAQQAWEQIEQGLTFGGLVAFEDSPRPGVKETIATCARAGIRTVMVTGDHPLTAAFIAKQVGIDTRRVITGDELDQLSDEALRETVQKVSVFARSTPEHKYRIVRALQANQEVVTVTGDGINDVLALKAADIGIAMGIKGTDVAKEAASVVLADDNFNTIAMGIFEGRGFFDNLQKGMKYYLAVKMALVLIFLLSVLLNVPLPFAPIQLILLEMFMDLAASAAFVAEPKEADIYDRPPRDPKEDVLNRQAVQDIAVKACALFAAVFVAYLYAYQHIVSPIAATITSFSGSTVDYAYLQTPGLVEAQTLAFAAWILAHIALAFISRSDKLTVIEVGMLKNRVMVLWAVTGLVFLLLVIYVPALSALIKLTAIPASILLLTWLVVLVIMSVLEMRKIVARRHVPSAPVEQLPRVA